MKPKVRARDNLVAEDAGAHLEGEALAADERRREIDLDVEMEAGVRASSPQQSPSSTRIGFRTLMNLRGADSSRMPTSSIASTKAAELPSMIGTSLLSISMIAVVDSEAAKGGEQMLDGADRDAGVVADDRAEREVLDVARRRPEFRR